jgi:hypothetical protein
MRWNRILLVRLEFDVEPPVSFTTNNKSPFAQPEFVKTELHRLEQLGCIRRVSVVCLSCSVCSVHMCCAVCMRVVQWTCECVVHTKNFGLC